MRWFVGLFALVCLCGAFAAPPKQKTARVVLFKQGLGYVEKVFTVEGDAVVELQFDESQIPDILNSLVVIDRGGGIIADIGYDSKTPREKLLEEIFGGRDVGGLVGALTTFKGAEAVFTISGKKIVGRILGVERYQRSKEVTSWRVSVLTKEGAVTSFDVGEITSFRLSDPSLQKDLARYLKLVAESFKRRRKTIRIQCKGKGRREILVAYTIEIPVWKTSHRFVLKKDKALCQSWAIVDNTTLEDWRDVQMVLMAGVPVVFKYDLYSPVYTRRRELRPRGFAQAPPTKPAPVPSRALRKAARVLEEEKAYAAGRLRREAPKAKSFDALSNKNFGRAGYVDAYGIGAGVVAAAATGKLGSFFVYRITHPVTVLSKKSAMIPIVSRDIPAERVLYFRYGSNMVNPYQAVRITNKSDMVLDEGPASVYEEGTFLGNALLPRLEPDQKGLVCFAVEQGVEVRTEWETPPRRAYMLAAQEGYIIVYYWQYKALKVRIKNNTKDKKRLIFDYPYNSAWKLINPKAEREGDYLRFEFDAPAKKETVVRIEFRTSTTEHYALGNFDSKRLERFVRNGWLSDEQRRAIQEIIHQRRVVAQVEEQIRTMRAQHRRLVSEQARLRSNLQVLRGETHAIKQLRARYIKRLMESEDQIQNILARISQAEKRLSTERERLRKMINDLVFRHEVR